jgi:hypothetical protein
MDNNENTVVIAIAVAPGRPIGRLEVDRSLGIFCGNIFLNIVPLIM